MIINKPFFEYLSFPWVTFFRIRELDGRPGPLEQLHLLSLTLQAFSEFLYLFALFRLSLPVLINLLLQHFALMIFLLLSLSYSLIYYIAPSLLLLFSVSSLRFLTPYSIISLSSLLICEQVSNAKNAGNERVAEELAVPRWTVNCSEPP